MVKQSGRVVKEHLDLGPIPSLVGQFGTSSENFAWADLCPDRPIGSQLVMLTKHTKWGNSVV